MARSKSFRKLVQDQARKDKKFAEALLREGVDVMLSSDGNTDLIGAVDGLPADLSARTKRYLKATSYGRKRAR